MGRNGSGSEARVVWTTCADEAAAARLASALVERRLAACVQLLGPIRSFYRWEGRVQDDREVLVSIKTVASAVARVTAAIEELHDYDVPQVLVLAVDGGAEAYLRWLAREVDAG